jgi:hypothetical protein
MLSGVDLYYSVEREVKGTLEGKRHTMMFRSWHILYRRSRDAGEDELPTLLAQALRRGAGLEGCHIPVPDVVHVGHEVLALEAKCNQLLVGDFNESTL